MTPDDRPVAASPSPARWPTSSSPTSRSRSGAPRGSRTRLDRARRRRLVVVGGPRAAAPSLERAEGVRRHRRRQRLGVRDRRRGLGPGVGPRARRLRARARRAGDPLVRRRRRATPARSRRSPTGAWPASSSTSCSPTARRASRAWTTSPARAARHRLVVDFHGCTIPRGLQRTWPNVLTARGRPGRRVLVGAAGRPRAQRQPRLHPQRRRRHGLHAGDVLGARPHHEPRPRARRRASSSSRACSTSPTSRAPTRPSRWPSASCAPSRPPGTTRGSSRARPTTTPSSPAATATPGGSAASPPVRRGRSACRCASSATAGTRRAW